MNVVCVRQGDKYGPEYVTMLKSMVLEHLDKDLFVLGDQEDADLPLTQGYVRWWAKLELFRPDLQRLRPFLYFDLDTYILQDIRDMLIEPERLMLIYDFNRPTRGNSGVMLIPKNTGAIWARRRTDVADGDYLNTHPHDYMQDRFEGIRSYKKHCKEGPGDARVCCFHGQPKPHETTGWAREVWRRYTEIS